MKEPSDANCLFLLSAFTTGRCAFLDCVLSLTLSTGLRLSTKWLANFFQQPSYSSMASRGRMPVGQSMRMTKMTMMKMARRMMKTVRQKCFDVPCVASADLCN